MAHVPTPPTASRTALWGLGFKVELIALRFDKLRNDIQDIWLIGTWLSYPFYAIGYYLFGARDLVWQTDDTLVNAVTWIRGLTEGNVILDILERLWYEFRYLKADPIGWVSAKIDQVSGELRYLRLDPYGWMRSRLYLAIPAFYNILGNSGWWIYKELSNRYPLIGNLIRDSMGFVRNRVISLFGWARALDWNAPETVIYWLNLRVPWFHSFIANPSGFIYSQLTAYNWEVHSLLTDPNRWAKEKIGNVLGISAGDMDNFVPFLIKRMFSLVLSNHLGLLDYTKEAIINLVLKFI